ncbi:LPXTG cell wall anchor domain-containing protein [Streptomyces sp. 8N616]|uniref:LPXTG cell wall anchor domain-containing protein n=1 Tax=Streptomyces sp. 8N616 TaxID=3457414 RepID=UPI003FCF0B47
MRTLSSACAVTAAAAASLLLGPAAYATPPGDNGTVKIHDAETGEELRRNEPHVCSFYLDAFGFDGEQQVTWKIVEMPPTGIKGDEASSGELTLDAEGHGRSEDMTLADGHYKLIWNFDGEHGEAKHKVFWTACEDDDEQTGGDTGGKPSEKPGGESSQEPTAEPSASDASASPAPAPSQNGGGEDLAETGASVVGTSVAAALLLGAGGVLVMRRRKARGQD